MNLRPFLCLTSIVALSWGIQAKPLPEVYHGQREIVEAANAPSATTDGDEGWPEISHASEPHNALWRFSAKDSG